MSNTAASVMMPDQRYAFDLRGYLVIPDVIPPPLLWRIHRVFDEFEDPVARQKYKPWAKFRQPNPLTLRIEQLLEADDAFVEMSDPPPVLPIVKELIGAPIRLCQTYAFLQKKGANTGLHGGGALLHHRFLYRHENNTFRCGMLKVVYPLRDVNPCDGGFAVIPGSHRSRVPCPYYGRDVREVPFLEEVTAKAGSAIMFTGVPHFTLSALAPLCTLNTAHGGRTLPFD